MYVTIKPFTYRGKRYQPGDKVPAESWPSRRMFIARKRIEFREPSADDVTPTDLKSMTRDELNVFASKLGIEDPKSFPNKDSLIDAINGGSTDDSTEDSGDAESQEESEEEEEVVPVEEDTLGPEEDDAEDEDENSEEDSEDTEVVEA